MKQSDWKFGLVFENGLHEEIKVSTWWTQTPNPTGSRYVGVLSRDSVWITFAYSALNEPNVCANNIINSYLHDP